MKKMFASTRNKIIAVIVLVVVVVTGVLGGTFVYYQSHILPSTTISGVAVGGLTKSQAVDLIEKSASEQQVTLGTSAGSETVNVAEAGVTIDVEASVNQVLGGGNFITGLISGGGEYSVLTELDKSVVEKTAKSLELADGDAAVDAAVAYDQDSQKFVVSDAIPGKAYDSETLGKDLQALAETLESGEVAVQMIVGEPAIITASAQVAADTATQWLGAEVAVDDDDGLVQSPDINTLGGWVKFVAEEGGITPSIDPIAVQTWVDAAALESNILPKPGYHNVNAAGEIVVTVRQPTDGWKANNTAAIAKTIVDGMAGSDPIYATFTYETDVAGWEDRPVAAGAEGLAYQPADGERWIDANLSNATVTAYEGINIVGGPYYMVPGAPGTETITGEFNVYLKYETQTMRGDNLDGTKYVTEDVPWVTYFSGGYGFHGAPWRTSFGWSGVGGSHGCINMPVAAAKFIYDWSQMGDKVVSHY